MKFMVAGTYVVVICMLPSIFIADLRQQPPYHCRYLVPVKTVPHVYACSEYPRPMVKP